MKIIQKANQNGLFLELRHRVYFGRFLPGDDLDKAKKNLKKSKEVHDKLINLSQKKKKELLRWSKLSPQTFDKMIKMESISLIVCYIQYYGTLRKSKKAAEHTLIFLKNIVKYGFIEEMYMRFSMEACDVARIYFINLHNFKQAIYCLSAATLVMEKYANVGTFTKEENDTTKSLIKFHHVCYFNEMLKKWKDVQNSLVKFDGLDVEPEIPKKLYEPPRTYARAKEIYDLAMKFYVEGCKISHTGSDTQALAYAKLIFAESYLAAFYGGISSKELECRANL